jgi:hypothetical protein
MIFSVPTAIQGMPHLQSLVEKIDELLELRAVSHHDYLKILLPKGLLHWSTVIESHVAEKVSVEMGVMGTSLEIAITPSNHSDTSNALVDTLKFDRDNGESIYAINSAFLSVQDIRGLISYLVSEFWPYSVSITERE